MDTKWRHLVCSFVFRSPYLSFRLFRLTLSQPLPELPLTFFAFVVGEDVRENAPGDVLDFVLRNAGIVDEFLSTSQVEKFPSGSICNFQGTSVGMRVGVSR